MIWILCISNVFAYIVRIGIDNWAPPYVSEHLHFNKGDAVNTIFYFEIGALVASLLWGYISDLLKRTSCDCSDWMYVYDYLLLRFIRTQQV